MFHRLLVPIKPALQPQVELDALIKLAHSSEAALIFVAVEATPDVTLTGRSAALVLDAMHERRDLAEAALRWVREHTKELDVETHVVRGPVVDAVLAAAKECSCDAIALTQRAKAWPSFLTGRIGDAIVRESPLPVVILKA